MRVYLHDERTAGALESLCVSHGIEVFAHRDVVRERQQTHRSAPRLFLNEVDALVIEMTKPTQEMQFIIAQALLTQKPTLCVYAKNYPPRELLSYIKQQPQPRSIKTFSYVAKTLPDALDRFLRMHSTHRSDRENIPSIKYTLRLTPKADRYLQWKSEQNGIAKADILRETILKLAATDEEYRDALALFDDE